jgi:type II secretion system protein N
VSAARAIATAAPAPGGDGRAPRLRGWLRANRRPLGYAAFTAAVFLIALAYSLPHDLIARRALDGALRDAPIDVAFREVGFAFPNGYRFRDLTLTGGLPDARISLEAMTVRAPLRSLVTGVAAADFSGELFGGEMSGSAAENGAGAAAVELHVEDMDLARAALALFPALAPPSAVAGRADVDLSLSGDGRTTRSSAGTLAFAVRDLALSRLVVQGITLPDLAFTEVTGAAAIQGTRLELRELRADGPEADLALSGDVLLREPIEQSVLNLDLVVEVAPNAQPAVRMATAFLPPRPAGQAQKWAVRGTLARPSVK